ncbi:Cell surface proteoglycan that bears heparan sulfate [Sarracenia purpurea var. burkii]
MWVLQATRGGIAAAIEKLDREITHEEVGFSELDGFFLYRPFGRVKFTCGQVRWSSNRIAEDRSSKLPESRPNWELDEEDSNFRSTLLSTKIRQFQESVPRSRGFYSNLAETLCADDSFAEKRETAPCWNGQRVAE